MLLARPVPVRLRGVTVTPTDPADINRQIRAAERALADRRAEVAALEAELRRLRDLAGRRPGDGSDQPALFPRDAQGNLF